MSIHNFKQINSYNNNYILTDPLEEINLIEIVNSSLLDIPLNPLIIYNWFCINGEIPFLSTNYLKNNTIKINHCENEKEPILQRNNKIIMKYTKNISKELLNFIEILEENFQKEIRENLLNSINNKNNLSKESEILLTIIETEPSLVQIFPYLLYFLFNELNNEKNYGIQNVQISVLYYLNAILNNKYFDFLPYLKDIIDCIIKLILFDNNNIIYNNNNEIFSIINIKNYSLYLLLKINEKTLNLHNKNILIDIISLFKELIIPKKNNLKYFECYGAIKSLNTFGIENINEYIYPNLLNILDNIEEDGLIYLKDKIINITLINKNNNNNNINNIIDINNLNDNNNILDNNNISENKILKINNSNNNNNDNSQITFTLPLTATIPQQSILLNNTNNNLQINNSISINNTNLSNNLNNNTNSFSYVTPNYVYSKFKIEKDKININNKKEYNLINNENLLKNKIINKSSTCLYYILFDCIKKLLNSEFNNNNNISKNIIEIFGENIYNEILINNFNIENV